MQRAHENENACIVLMSMRMHTWRLNYKSVLMSIRLHMKAQLQECIYNGHEYEYTYVEAQLQECAHEYENAYIKAL